ncbi:hypothetical protein [Frondihabitans australicus]|uniref:Uncharacterized protein n=1 Tax=Frondihabitans australicus TaxID=386892 RepID=A0A495IDV1_9MICO|nr:hypothetical protein [Frondihabitans australicus]RKR73186.1 hypothetical protein C8E83_0276 [Frondihabitans australicus]
MDAEIADLPEHARTHADTQRRVAETLVGSLDGTDWAEAGLFWAEIDGRVLARVETIDRAGQTRDHALPEALSAEAHDLRERMAVADKGTWFSVALTVAATGDLTWRFNYDRRVYDNPASPFAAGPDGAVPDDEAYGRDVAAHPRDERHTPLWLRQGAASAAVPYDLLNDAWGWPGVFASVQQQSALAREAFAAARVSAEGGRHGPATLSRREAESLAQHVLTAVVADVLEPHRLATLLGLHAEAVSRRLLPPVPGLAELDPDVTLAAAREASSPALLAVEAGVYGIIGDVVRAQLGA